MIYGYIRKTTDEPAVSAMQLNAVLRCAVKLDDGQGYQVHFYEDTGIPGSVPLWERLCGQALLEAANEGDRVIFSRMADASYTVSGIIGMVRDLNRAGVTVHFADTAFDLNTKEGRNAFIDGYNSYIGANSSAVAKEN